jgi:ATP-dependent DNA helicase RecG
LEDDVKFKKLGLAIIDEQHRFGVIQRLKLVEKGEDVDVLLMSATPIPRSLMMGLYGDMDISILNEKPKNRQPIETLVMSAKKIADVYQSLKRAVLRGEKIYWICPAIEESEEVQLVSAKQKFSELSEIFGAENVALLHGKMKESEKEKVMNEFSKRDGSLKLLVSTTVIEVGIDVPEATVILIENSENFGLSQLHQLRGRVGRSDKKSFCILLYGEKFGVNGRKRLGILRESNDGFFIAEEDLKIRGSGDLLGTKQSGFPEFKIADLNLDTDLLKIAHKNAELILHHDEKLQSKKHRDLLRLFSYDDCLRMINSG